MESPYFFLRFSTLKRRINKMNLEKNYLILRYNNPQHKIVIQYILITNK